MSTKNDIASFGLKQGYNGVATFLGFLVHPYRTMQKVVEKHIPLLLMFFPLFLCVIGWSLAHFAAMIFISFIPLVGFWWFLETWWMTFWTMWQITLLYLYWRFSSISRE